MPETTWFSPDDPPKVGDGYNFLSADVLLHTDDGDFVGFYDTDFDLWYRCSRWGTPKKLPKGTVKGWRPLKEERK